MLTDAQIAQNCAAVRSMKGHPIARGLGEINTDYIEGMDLDGTPNENRKNAFDDLHVIYTYRDGRPVLLFKAEATTQPGARYTLRPINEEGAAICDLGYQECWQPGLHRGKYPALIQTGGSCRVWRDRSKSYARGQGTTTSGWYGINQHHAYDADRSDIGSHSAGCLVTRLVAKHEEALAIKKSDPRYVADHKFVFGACLMTAAWVTGSGDHDARPRPDIKPDVPKTITHGGGGAATTLTLMGSYFTEHWPIIIALGLAVMVGAFIFYWREPYGRKEGDAPRG